MQSTTLSNPFVMMTNPETILLAVERSAHRADIDDVTFDHLDALAPRHIVEFGGRSRHCRSWLPRSLRCAARKRRCWP